MAHFPSPSTRCVSPLPVGRAGQLTADRQRVARVVLQAFLLAASLLAPAPVSAAAGAAAGPPPRVWPPQMLPEVVPGAPFEFPRIGRHIGDFDTFAVFGIWRAQGGSLWRTDGTPEGTYELLASAEARVNADLTGSFFVARGRSRLYFTATDNAVGRVLFATDGTTGGTRRLAEGFGVILEAFYAPKMDRLFFVESTEDFTRLRIADAEGRVSDVAELSGTPQSGPRVRGFAEFGAHVYFADQGFGGPDTLWRSDGTVEGTVPFFEGHDTVGQPIAGETALFFSASAPGPGFWLWRSDGTASGTSRLIPLENVRNYVEVLGDRLVYLAPENSPFDLELWATDGTEEGTVRLTDYSEPLDRGPRFSFARLGERLLIAGGGSDSDPELYRELIVTDGTLEGTETLVECSDPCIPVGTPYIQGDLALFSRVDDRHGREPWQTDGTTDGTRLVADLCPGACDAGGGVFEILGDTYLWLQWSPEGRQPVQDAELLWRNGPGRPIAFTKFAPENPFGSGFGWATIGDRLVFVAADGVHGRELWVSRISSPRRASRLMMPRDETNGGG